MSHDQMNPSHSGLGGVTNNIYSTVVQRGKIRVQCFVICIGDKVLNLYTKAVEHPIQTVELFKRGSQ